MSCSRSGRHNVTCSSVTSGGRVVRKDLTKLVKEGANVPVYVLEYLLGSPIDCAVCATPEALTADRVQAIRNRLAANRDYDSSRRKAESAVRDLEGMARSLVRIARQMEPQPVALKREWRRKHGFSIRKVRELMGITADVPVREWLRSTAPLLRTIRAVNLAAANAGNASETFNGSLTDQTSTSLLREAFEACAAAYRRMKDTQAQYAESTTRLRSEG
jgi:hypothetical protein